MRIANRTVGGTPSQYTHTKIDTGTTFLYLPPRAYRALRASFASRCPWGACETRNERSVSDDDICYRMSSEEVTGFETVSMHFAGGDDGARGRGGADGSADGGAEGLDLGLGRGGLGVPSNEDGSSYERRLGVDRAPVHVFALRPRQYIYELRPGVRCLAAFERQAGGTTNRARKCPQP